MIKLLSLLVFAGWFFQTDSVFCQIHTAAAPDSSRLALKKPPLDDWLGKDKFDHAMTSAGLVAAQFYFLRQELEVNAARSRQIAAGSALTIGIAKEIYDRVSRRGTPSWKDLLADVVGIGVAVILITK